MGDGISGGGFSIPGFSSGCSGRCWKIVNFLLWVGNMILILSKGNCRNKILTPGQHFYPSKTHWYV